jgi:hypothetical protein
MRILGYIALLAWLALGWKYWTDYKHCKPSTALPEGVSDKECPLCFEWSHPTVMTCENWTSYRDSLLSALGNDNTLRITGQFNPNESTDQELGRNRAISVKALFNGLLPEENILIDVEELDDTEFEGCKSRTKLDVLVEGKVVQQNSLASAVFYLNKDQFIDSPSIMSHIEEVAEHTKNSKDKIRIIGHTDSQGSQKDNIIRGYRYADQMKSYFLDKGVSLERLITISKGENESNSSNEQSLNRVEVTITKS